MPPIHLDLTEIVRHSLRSGIQRVEREAIRHWEGPKPIPCVIDKQGRVLRLHPAVLEVLCDETDSDLAARAAERARLTGFLHSGVPLVDETIGRLLNLELFYDPVRTDAHLRMAANGVRVMFYLYDFLPFLRPELFPPGTTQQCMHFLRAVRSAGDRLAFLSQRTRDDYATRIARRPPPECGWPVLDPGADGLALEPQTFEPERRHFVSIGTIEARKNVDAMLDAFVSLWDRGVDVQLTMAGRVAPGMTRAQQIAMRPGSRLVLLEEPNDDELRHVLRQARAVIMPSEAEGFGLPPYEALHAGIAVIASARLPSASHMASGAMLLERMDAASMAGAIESMRNDEIAARLWSQAAALDLPSWRDFGRQLANWARNA